MKYFFYARIVFLLLCLFAFQNTSLYAQDCKESDDLLDKPGKFIEDKHPIGGFVSDYSAAEKSVALKILNALKKNCLKNFTLSGGVAKDGFNFEQKLFFGNYYHATYEYRLLFYDYSCVNGKAEESSEYGVDLEITANPSVYHYFDPESIRYFGGYYADASKNSGPYIGIFQYLVFENRAALENLNSGTGFFEENKGSGEAYSNQMDVHRTWYLMPTGKKLLTVVSRKEYLKNLLVFYEREIITLGKDNQRLQSEAVRYMAQYEKSGNKQMFQSHLENKQKADKEVASIVSRYQTKKEKVTNLLTSKPAGWLEQPAMINPQIRNRQYCDSDADYNQSGYFTFNDFYNRADGNTVYKWNPEYFKQQTQSPAVPLFFKVRFRYKTNSPFSKGITDNYIKGLDREAIRSLIGVK